MIGGCLTWPFRISLYLFWAPLAIALDLIDPIGEDDES